MYRLDSFVSGGALIINESIGYRSTFNTSSLEEAEQIAVNLNQQDLFEQLAQRRFSFETAGLDVGSLRVKTDRESLGQITSAFVSLMFDLIPNTDFKAVQGWAELTKEQMMPIAKATAAHTRACFRGEKIVSDAVKAAASDTDISAIDIDRDFAVAYQTAFDEVMGVAE